MLLSRTAKYYMLPVICILLQVKSNSSGSGLKVLEPVVVRNYTSRLAKPISCLLGALYIVPHGLLYLLGYIVLYRHIDRTPA